MYKKIIFVTSIIVLSHVGFAETCPTVQDIKNNQLHGWKIRDSEDGNTLSLQRETAYKKDIEQFALAEWKQGKRNSTIIHCYYRNNSGAGLEAYLVKENFSPINANHYWYQVSGYQECAAGMSKCEFGQSPLPKSHLATSGTSTETAL